MLNDVKSLVARFESEYPDEPIVFAGVAHYNEHSQGARRRGGWGRRGVLILTQQQIFFKSVFLSLYTVILLAAALVFFAIFYRTEEVLFMILTILALASTFNRLPFQRQIPLPDVERAEAGPEKVLTWRGFQERGTLKLEVQGNTVQLDLKQVLPDEARRLLRADSPEDYPEDDLQ
jgi:hypothetical protein